MTIDYKIIGERIKASRLNRSMTQAELAEQTEMSDVYISRIETGARSPSLNSLLKIANTLGTTLDSLAHGKTFARLPKTYRYFAELLEDCDEYEHSLILENAHVFKLMLREKS